MYNERIRTQHAPDWECFFTQLHACPWDHIETILAGDFNCVLSPAIDRLGGSRTGRSESQALENLLRKLELEDASNLIGHAEEQNDAFEPSEYYTYWGPEATSRLDRIYVPQHWTNKVQSVAVDEPAAPSEHQRVRLYLGRAQTINGQQNRRRAVVYPIRSAHPESTQNELLGDLRVAGIGRN